MRWRRTRRSAEALDAPRSPVVVAVTSVLNRQTARDLALTVERLEPGADVVIDLTGIPGFDTDGAAELMHLQESTPTHRVSIVGMRQATARLVGDLDSESVVSPPPIPQSAPEASETGWVTRHLRNLVVVQVAEGQSPSTDSLEPVLTGALQTPAAIVVVDLRGVADVTPDGLHAITFASSSAALRGQELLVVNVSPAAVELLRTAGLSATTFVAPAPLDNLPGTTF